VLLCGVDEKLLHYRRLVLERAGFDVETALTSAEAAEWFRVKRFGLAVLGSGLTQGTRQTLQILCWQARVQVYETPPLTGPEEMIRAVAARVKRWT
jgi:DNA-binding response OmpR family regulator